MKDDSVEPDSATIGSDQAARSLLIIVPRDRVDLYQSLSRSFSDPNVQVIVDRRVGDRRAGGNPPNRDRRRADRRLRVNSAADLKAGRCVTVPLSASATDLLDPDTRAILFLCCSEHVVGCLGCQNSYRLRWLPRTDLGLYACPLCGNDLTAAVLGHTETCWYWATRRATRKPPARIERRYPLADAAS
jgi:hypothetical protein